MSVTQMERERILSDTKLLLGLDTDEKDALVRLITDDMINAVLSYCRIEFLPRQLYGLVAAMSAKLCRAEVFDECEIVSVEEGERKVVFASSSPEDVITVFAERLKPFVNRRGRLVSEVGNESG